MKKNLLSIVILALLLVNIALTAVMMISVTSTNNKTAALVTSIATVMNLELTDGSDADANATISLADTEVYEIADSLTIPLKIDEDGKQYYMVCNVSLQINTKHEDYETLDPLVETNESLIKDKIRSVISSKTENECQTDQEGLKAEILKAIQELFGSDFIYGIAFGEIKYG